MDHAAVHDLPELAASFANEIPANANITPAECQAWLLANRVNPLAAVNGAAAWAAEIVENKSRGANVAKFSNEIDRPTKAVPTEAAPTQAASTLSPPTVVTPTPTALTPPNSPSLHEFQKNFGANPFGAEEEEDSDSDSIEFEYSEKKSDRMAAELISCRGNRSKLLAFKKKYDIETPF